jgi:hypothetical protein
MRVLLPPRLLLLFLLLITLAFPRGAGGQTAGATVVVGDENGVAVVSARVVLEMGSLPAAECWTDFAGRCVFRALAPGTYQLRVEKEGFYALVRNVEIAPGAAIDVAISRQQEFREVVDVKESPPAIDPAQVAMKEEMSGLDVVNMVYPTTTDYRNALNFIPGVVQDQSGQPHVAGAETYQTVTLLDGFNVTQPANGQLLVRVSTDAFRSIQVEPSREPAEDGKGSGGVLSLNTGIGDDHFRFLATDFIPSVQDKHGLRFDQFLPRLTFSGPLRKGKTWFYNALDGEYDNTIYTELPVGQDNDHTLRVGDLFKVQSNLTSRNILTASVLGNFLYDQYDGLSPLNPQLSTAKDVESDYVTSLKDQHYFAGGELLEAGLAFDQYNLRLTPYGDLPYVLPAADPVAGSCYLNEATHARRWQALSNLYLPSHQWHGRHDFKVGVDLDRIFYDAAFERQPVSFLQPLQAGQAVAPCPVDGNGIPIPSTTCARYSTFTGGQLSETYNFEASVYAEDRWSVTNRLLIEAGVRLDWDEIVRHAEVAPRLAGTYVLDNSGTTKLSAGIGLVYDATPIFLVARPYAGERTDYFFDTSGNIASTVLTTFAASRGALEVPRFLNWSVGLEKKLPKAIYLKAEFMEKRGSRGFVYDTLDASEGGNFVLQNTRDDRYDAFQIALRHNFRESYMIMGSYTRSRARSNEVLDFNVDNPIFGAQQAGVYPWDTPNRFLSWGYLPFFKLPALHQTEVAYSLEARTGFPFSAINDQAELIGPADALRFPRYLSLNLQLEKRFHLFGYYLALRGGFDNITGRCNPYVVDSVEDVNHPSPTFSACEGRAFTSRIRLLGKK